MGGSLVSFSPRDHPSQANVQGMEPGILAPEFRIAEFGVHSMETLAIEFGFSDKPCDKLLDGKKGMTDRFLLRAFPILPVDTLSREQ